MLPDQSPPDEPTLTIAEFCKKLGRQEIADAVNVKRGSVDVAVYNGTFAPSWFDGIEKLAKSKDVECPRALFAFREAKPLPQPKGTEDA